MSEIIKQCWIGPRPFTNEPDELKTSTNNKVIINRDKDNTRICKQIMGSDITIISGASGVGKSSLITSSLIPSLEYIFEGGYTDVLKPVIYFNCWGDCNSTNVCEVLNSQLEKLILKRIEDEKFAQTGEPNSSLQSALIKEFGALYSNVKYPNDYPYKFGKILDCYNNVYKTGLVLIFDQFEEVLRLDKYQSNNALKVITSSLNKSGVKVVISMRTEYEYKLNSLERITGGLYNRRITIEPLKFDICRQAITEKLIELNHFEKSTNSNSDSPNTNSDSEILDKILLACSSNNLENLKTKASEDNTDNDDTEIDLIALQSVMYDIWDSALQLGLSDSCSLRELLSNYLNNRINSQTKSSKNEITTDDLSQLPELAMQNWVNTRLSNDCLDNNIIQQLSEELDITMNMANKEVDIKSIFYTIKMLAGRISLYVSSGGYKIPINIVDLKAKILRNDLIKLCENGQRVIQEEFVKAEGDIAKFVDSQEIDISDEYVKARADISLSGLSIIYELPPVKVINILSILVDNAIDLLNKASVLRKINENNKIIVELVHDKMGTPFAQWGEKLEQSWENAVFSLTATRGTDINHPKHATKITSQISSVRWLGCFIQSQSKVSNATLRDIEFKNSIFNGSIFFNCTLENVTFTNCDLDGIIFLNCTFGSPIAKGTDNEELEKLSLKNSVKIQSCKGNGWSILDTRVKDAKSKTGKNTESITNDTPQIHSLSITNSRFEHFRCINTAITHKFVIENTHLKHFEINYTPRNGERDLDTAKFEISSNDNTLPEETIDSEIIVKNRPIMEYCTWDNNISKIIDIGKGVTLIGCGTSLNLKNM